MQQRLNEVMETLAERVAYLRNRANMTQQKLADLSGLQQSDISKIERGDVKKTTGVIGLARALHCNPYWLEDGDGDPFTPPGWPYSLFSMADYKLITPEYRDRIENELAGEVIRAKKRNGTDGP